MHTPTQAAAAAAIALGLSLPGLAFADIDWRQDAAGVLSLQESIADNHDGTYTYSYTFSNLDEALPVWWVVVYTNGTPSLSSALGDAAHVGWSSFTGASAGSDIQLSGYTGFAYTWTSADAWPSSTPNGVGLGQTVAGFSFTTTVFDPSAKRFVADREGEWVDPRSPDGQQSFSYGGWTQAVPEPQTYALMLAGLLGLAVGPRLRRPRPQAAALR
jgi:hypothetical protein